MAGPWEKYQKASAPQAEDGPWAKYQSAANAETPKDDSLANDVYVKTTEGLLFGARPFVAGVGGGIGGALERITRDDDAGLAQRLKESGSQFQKYFAESKNEARAEEADVSARRPGLSAGIGVGTALATAPLFALKGLQSANAAAKMAEGGKLAKVLAGLGSGVGQSAKTGALIGSAQALGHADSTGEAIETIGTGALIGGLVQGGANAVSMAAKPAAQLLKKGAIKVGHALSGLPEKEITTYASRADEVQKILKTSGGDIPEAADQIRRKVTKDIQVARQTLNNQIDDALSRPQYQNVRIEGKPIVDALEKQLATVNKRTAQFESSDINELKNVIDMTKQALDKSGRIDFQTLSSLKGKLQDIATPAYNNGQVIFSRGSLAAKAAKSAGAEARRILNARVPEIAKANNQLSRLHRIEELMNKNLIREGKPEAALLAAGSGGNPRNAKILAGIDDITGGDALRQAENLAAARTFGNIPTLPWDATGKAAARMAAGAGVGYVTGGEQGAIVGAALSSPRAIKLALDTARFSSNIARATGGGIASMLPRTPVGTGRAAMLSGGVQRATSGEGPAVDSTINRRLRFLDKNRNTKSNSGR